ISRWRQASVRRSTVNFWPDRKKTEDRKISRKDAKAQRFGPCGSRVCGRVAAWDGRHDNRKCHARTQRSKGSDQAEGGRGDVPGAGVVGSRNTRFLREGN